MMKKYFKVQNLFALLLIFHVYGLISGVFSNHYHLNYEGEEQTDQNISTLNRIHHFAHTDFQITSNDVAELPDALRSIYVSNQTELNNAIAVSIPGDHIILSNGSYSLGALSKSGTESHPIVIRAANILGVNITSSPTITGSFIRFWGLNFGDNNLGAVDGSNVWVIRCKWAGSSTGIRIRAQAPGFHAWYCQMSGNGRQIAADLGAAKTGTNGHIKGCYFHDVAPGGANATETVTIGFSEVSNKVANWLVEDSYFQNCNIGGKEGETVCFKSYGNTLRNCTGDNIRFFNNRHGVGNVFDRLLVKNTSQGGIGIHDSDGMITNCSTIGGSGIRLYAGSVLSFAEGGPPLGGTSGHRAAYRWKIYNTNAGLIRVGYKYTDNHIYPVKNTEIRGNGSGVTVTLLPDQENTNASEEWTQPAPEPYTIPNPPVALTLSQVGPFANLPPTSVNPGPGNISGQGDVGIYLAGEILTVEGNAPGKGKVKIYGFDLRGSEIFSSSVETLPDGSFEWKRNTTNTTSPIIVQILHNGQVLVSRVIITGN